MNKKIYALLLSMILLLTSAAPVSAASTHLSKSKITIGVSQNYTLKLSNNKKKLRWSSSKRSVATVNSKGKVTGKKKGTAVITATVGKSKYKCTITVKKPVMSKSKLSLNTGMSCTLKILYNNKKVKWSSNKKSVATVSSKGKVTAKKTGTATITIVMTGMKPSDWKSYDKYVCNAIMMGLLEEGYSKNNIDEYFKKAGEIKFTKTHGKKVVGGMTRVILMMDFLEYEGYKLFDDHNHQLHLSDYLNKDMCKPAGFDKYGEPLQLLESDMQRLGIAKDNNYKNTLLN